MTESTVLDNPRWTKLSCKRQDELLEEYRDINVDHEWWDYTYDWFKEKCAAVGIDVGDIYFSGFWSQGDGACFTGAVSDWPKVLKAVNQENFLKYKPEENYWRFGVTTSGRYMHAYTMSSNLEAELEDNPYDEEDEPLQFDAWAIKYDLTEGMLEHLVDDLLKFCRDLANDLYKALKEEYEYLTSDEVIVEYILENLDDDELRDPDEELDQEDAADPQVDHTHQLELF